MTGLLTCVFKVTCFNEKKVFVKVLVKVWHTFGVHLLVLVLPILFHEVYVLVLTILFKSIVNNTAFAIDFLGYR